MNVTGIIGHREQIKKLELIIDKERIPNTILFRGISGIGKKLIARRFFNALFCKSNNPPCLSCHVCIQIAKGIFPDLIEISTNEKGIIPIGNRDKRETGSVRWLIERVSKKPISDKFGIIIDSIDKTTEEGQNALLKTIEDPPSSVFYILITSSKAKLLPTILSRCIEIQFFPLSVNSIREILDSEGLNPIDLNFIADISGGSMETALLLSNRDIFNEIINICSEISSFMKDRTIFNINFHSMKEKISADILINIIINIYRYNLFAIIANNRDVYKHNEIFIEDHQKIFYLLKMLLVLKKIKVYNLDINNAMKGMMYALYDNSFVDIPFMDFSLADSGG